MKRILFRRNVPPNFTGFCVYYTGSMLWFKDGNSHRINGPAFEWCNGNPDWYLNGMPYTEEEYSEELKKL